MSSHPDRPSGERRARPRTSSENHATSLVQLILRDPVAAGDMLEDDVATGGKLEVVMGLLDAAEAAFRLRGVDASVKIAALRLRLKRHAG